MIHTDEDDEFDRIEREQKMKGQPYHWEADAIKAALEAKDDGITLTTIRHPKGKPALGDLNPESLEQMEIDFPEPVAWQWLGSAHFRKKIPKNADITAWNPLYTTPPQRTWVGLTDEEIEQGCKESWVTEQAFQSAAWWAEAKLKEKNT
jgi:hypothetical protein